jgi:hypothetical protein
MSRRHTEACRETGGSEVLSVDEILENTEKVWKNLPNCNIASAYIQAHRIASKVIREKGNNSGDLHCGVRNDFIESEGGLMRKDKKHIADPNPSNN